MSHADPIADMLTRVRNAARVQKEHVVVRSSGVCVGIAKVLHEQGYIADYDRIETTHQEDLRITLKYGSLGEAVIHEIKRISKPSCRVYCSVKDVPEVLAGLGVSIVSTSQGVLAGLECQTRNIGGEVLCTVH
jgi:small subunit ribosomal protein S8